MNQAQYPQTVCTRFANFAAYSVAQRCSCSPALNRAGACAHHCDSAQELCESAQPMPAHGALGGGLAQPLSSRRS